MRKLITLIILISYSVIMMSSCIFKQGTSKISAPSRAMGFVSVSNVQLVNNQLIVTGSNLNSVKNLKIEGQSVNEDFSIVSTTSSQIIATANRAANLGLGVFNLILSDAGAASTFAVSFTLQDGAVTASMLAPMGAQDGQVLKFNGTNWGPANLSNSQVYKGTYNASTNTPDLTNLLSAPVAGDYYVVTDAGVFNGITYPVNSWIIFNGTDWEKISNGEKVVSSFKGRRGAVIPLKSDYSLGLMSDVNLSAAPNTNEVLTFDGVEWVSSPIPPPAMASLPTLSAPTLPVSDKPTIGGGETIPEAFAKVQKTLNDISGGYLSKSAATQTVTGIVNFTDPTSYVYVNDPSPASPTEAVNVRYLQNYVSNLTNLNISKTAPLGIIDSLGTTVTGTGTNFTQVFSAGDKIFANSEVRTISTITSDTSLTTAAAFSSSLVASSYARVGAIFDSGFIGVGTNVPQTTFNIWDNDPSHEYQIQIDRFSGANSVPTPSGIRLNTSRGVLGAEFPAINGDELGKIDFGSSDGNHTTEGAVIKGIAVNTWGSGKHPTDMVFYTSPNSVSAPLERFRVEGDTGDVRVAGTVHAAHFVGDGSGITGISGAAGGVSNTGSTSIAADSGASGTGEIALATHGSTRMTIANNGLVQIGSSSGAGGLFSVSGSSNTELFRIENTASTINYALATGGINNSEGPTFSAGGSNADIGLNISSKGAGNLLLNASGAGKVGIGTSLPSAMLEIHEQDGTALKDTVRISRNSGGAVAPAPAEFVLTTARGTTAAPTALQSGDPSGSIDFQGYDGTAISDGAEIAAFTSGIWSNTSHPTDIKFSTVDIGSTALTERVRIRSNGELRLLGSTSGHVGFIPAAAAGSTTYTLPSADATIAGQTLVSDHAGVLAWASIMDGLLTTYVPADYVGKVDVAQGDSIKNAIGKIQRYVKDIDGDYVSKSADQTIHGTLRINSLTGFIEVPTPTIPTEAANKGYVDGRIGGATFTQTGLASGNFIRYNGSAWVNTALTAADIPILVTPNLGTPSALVGTNITGTASGLTAGNVTTNANLTGVITSVGNATSVGAQTGTGSTFVMDTSPTLTGTISLNGPTTVAANQNFVMASGTGTFSQTYNGTGSYAATITNTSATSGGMLSLVSSGTAAPGGMTTGLAISISGANAQPSITRYGMQSTVTSTGSGTPTNVGGYFSASGSTNNYGLIVAAGSVGIGTATPSVSLDIGTMIDAMKVPNGTTAQRPTAAAGLIRYNSTTTALEVSQGATAAWTPMTPRWFRTTAVCSANGTCASSSSPQWNTGAPGTGTLARTATGTYTWTFTGAAPSVCNANIVGTMAATFKSAITFASSSMASPITIYVQDQVAGKDFQFMVTCY